jgi:gamma-glutamyltranspeptidase/glutathione hydrolase
MKIPFLIFSLLVATPFTQTLAAVDLSPEKWGQAERARVEERALAIAPAAASIVQGESGVVSGTMSPIAVRAGLEALQQGGTAADAAATMALTQVTTALGSYISFAGMMQLTYFEAKTGKVYAMNAGWSSYLGETQPSSIPTAAAAPDVEPGRKTLVPGFMAGLEAMHHRFGNLPFAQLFEPAIWYAEKGVTISPMLSEFFKARQSFLTRTEGGKIFLHQGGDHVPMVGDHFVQADLAKTLRSVAKEGASFMYTGAWGEAFVAAVQAAGGKASMDDLRRYQPIWEEPLSTEFQGFTLFAPGHSTEGGYQIIQALNLLSELKVAERGPYWKDPTSLLDFSRVLQFAAAGPYVHASVAASAKASGVTLALEDRATKRYALAALPLLDLVFNAGQKVEPPKHSASIVVIDRWGNVAALVHSINTVLWGTTGLVVQGVPLADPAGFQQARLATLKPGDRVPNEMAPVIVVADGKPILAIATIGSSLIPETARLLVGVLGNKLDASAIMAAPPLLLNSDFTKRATVVVPAIGYEPGFLDGLRALGVTVTPLSQQETWNLAGTAVMGTINPKTGARQSMELPTIFSFAGGY